MSNLFEHCRTGVSSASQRYEKSEAMQINLLFAEAKYSRCSQSAISLCQSAAGGGCVGGRRRSDAALCMSGCGLPLFGCGRRANLSKLYFSRPPACGIALQKQPNSHFGKHPAPSIGRLLQGADLPPFVFKRWRQKCPQGTFVGIGRRFSLSGHKRLRCFARPLRALEPPSDLIPPPVQCGICGALRATMIYYDSNSSILKFSKPPRAEASARAAPHSAAVLRRVDNTPPRQSRIKFALFSA